MAAALLIRVDGRCGILRYLGPLRGQASSDGLQSSYVAGVEFEEAVGDMAGEQDGHVYFSCRQGHGRLVRLERLEPLFTEEYVRDLELDKELAQEELATAQLEARLSKTQVEEQTLMMTRQAEDLALQLDAARSSESMIEQLSEKAAALEGKIEEQAKMIVDLEALRDTLQELEELASSDNRTLRQETESMRSRLQDEFAKTEELRGQLLATSAIGQQLRQEVTRLQTEFGLLRYQQEETSLVAAEADHFRTDATSLKIAMKQYEDRLAAQQTRAAKAAATAAALKAEADFLSACLPDSVSLGKEFRILRTMPVVRDVVAVLGTAMSPLPSFEALIISHCWETSQKYMDDEVVFSVCMDLFAKAMPELPALSAVGVIWDADLSTSGLRPARSMLDGSAAAISHIISDTIIKEGFVIDVELSDLCFRWFVRFVEDVFALLRSRVATDTDLLCRLLSSVSAGDEAAHDAFAHDVEVLSKLSKIPTLEKPAQTENHLRLLQSALVGCLFLYVSMTDDAASSSLSHLLRPDGFSEYEFSCARLVQDLCQIFFPAAAAVAPPTSASAFTSAPSSSDAAAARWMDAVPDLLPVVSERIERIKTASRSTFAEAPALQEQIQSLQSVVQSREYDAIVAARQLVEQQTAFETLRKQLDDAKLASQSLRAQEAENSKLVAETKRLRDEQQHLHEAIDALQAELDEANREIRRHKAKHQQQSQQATEIVLASAGLPAADTTAQPGVPHSATLEGQVSYLRKTIQACLSPGLGASPFTPLPYLSLLSRSGLAGSVPVARVFV